MMLFLSSVSASSIGAVLGPVVYPAIYAGKTLVFALMGQSNMVGRFGPVDPILDATDPDIFMYVEDTNTLDVASDPLDNLNETADDVGLGLTFAKQILSDTGAARIILVGMANGGSGFMQGEMNPCSGTTWLAAKTRWELAWTKITTDYPTAETAGILWLQGEDEVIDYDSSFTGESGFDYICMPQSLMRNVREDFTGMNPDTPIVFGGLPNGTALIANEPVFGLIESRIQDTGNYLHKTASASGIDLTLGDDRHYDAPAVRTLGTRMASSFATAYNSTVAVPASPAFVPDPLNVETLVSIDVTAHSDFQPLTHNAGTRTVHDNKRVFVENGAMRFDGDSELRWGDNVPNLYLTDRDFSIKIRWKSDVTVSDDGLFALYNTSGNQRSYVARIANNDLQFYGSDTGTSAVLMLTMTNPNTFVWYDTEIRRIGTALSLTVNGVVEDTYTLSSGYTFYTATGTKALLGDYINARNFVGDISNFSIEFLS